MQSHSDRNSSVRPGTDERPTVFLHPRVHRFALPAEDIPKLP